MTSERDHLINQRLQAESDMSAKKLALSENRNRQASQKQAEDKIRGLTASTKTLAAEIEVFSSYFLSFVFIVG